MRHPVNHLADTSTEDAGTMARLLDSSGADPHDKELNGSFTPRGFEASLEQLKAAANGIVWHQEISTPAKGEYFLRIGMRDEHTDRFGAVEVVTSAIRNLPPSAGPPINAIGK